MVMPFHHGLAISGSHFSWKNGLGVAEMSDLRDVLRPHQVWPDACDVGFTVQGTHAVVTFVETGEKRDREGELQSRIFTAINPRTGRVDKSANALRIELFND